VLLFSTRSRSSLSLSLSLSLFRALLLLSSCWVWSLRRVGSEGRFVLSKIFYFLRGSHATFWGGFGALLREKGEIRSSRAKSESVFDIFFFCLFFPVASCVMRVSDVGSQFQRFSLSLSLSLSLSPLRERDIIQKSNDLSLALFIVSRAYLYTHIRTYLRRNERQRTT